MKSILVTFMWESPPPPRSGCLTGNSNSIKIKDSMLKHSLPHLFFLLAGMGYLYVELD